jgi:hypothetical protein
MPVALILWESREGGLDAKWRSPSRLGLVVGIKRSRGGVSSKYSEDSESNLLAKSGKPQPRYPYPMG